MHLIYCSMLQTAHVACSTILVPDIEEYGKFFTSAKM